MRRTLLAAAAVLAVALLGADAGALAGASDATKIKGHWTNPKGACTDHVISFDPATGDLECTGTSKWTGTWKGSTKWTLTGNMDPDSGKTSGRIHEVFKGKIADGRKGKLVFSEKLQLDANGDIDIHGHIVDSSGGLAGAHGKARWTGYSSVTDGSGSGPYTGSWHKPPPKHH
jgi:hypothetical protein